MKKLIPSMSVSTLAIAAFLAAPVLAQAQGVDLDSILNAAMGAADQAADTTAKIPEPAAEQINTALAAQLPTPTAEEMKNDAGVQAVIKMQEAAPVTPDKSKSAKEQVKNILKANGFKEGRTKERFIAIEEESLPLNGDPATDEDFLIKRDQLAKQLILQVKSSIITGIGTEFSAKDQFETFGSTNAVMSSEIGYVSSFPLYGVTVLAQAESWDGKNYKMAMAAVWSKKLHDAAKSTLLGKKPEGGSVGTQTIDSYLASRDLAEICGPRQFLDTNGNRVFLGIAAREIGINSLRDRNAKQIARTSAMSYLVFSLFADVEQSTAVSSALTLSENPDKTASSKVQEELNQKMSQKVDKRVVEGANEIYSAEITHPLSGKEMYVSVYSLDVESAAKARVLAEELIATRVLTELANKRAQGRLQGYRDQVDKAKANTEEFNKGRAEGNAAIESKTATPAGRTVNQISQPAASPAKPKAQQGIFSGETQIDDDI